MPTLDDVSLDPSLLLLVAAMAVLLFILVAFPSDVFNKTYENRREEIHGAIRALGVKRRNRMPSWLQATLLIVIAVGAALLSGKGEGPAAQPPGGNWALNMAAVLIAVPLVMAAYSGPGEIYLWRIRGRATLYVPPVALAVGVACAVFSQVCELNPTYAYGLFCTFILFRDKKAANRDGTKGASADTRIEPTEAQRAYGVLWSVAGLSALIALGYIGFSANWENAHAANAGWYTVLFDAVAYWVVVLGAESLVFALIPMRFLDGRTVAGWRLLAWMPLQIAAGFFFWYVIQRRGEVNGLRPTGDEWLRAMGFFLLFGLAAMTFWGYFQWKGRPTAGFSTRPMAPFTALFQPVTFAGRLRTEATELAKMVWRSAIRAKEGERVSLIEKHLEG
ncbi:FGLLP motif-containing membrane protein [Actinoplanes campanulatus]|nr:FGLLP motif-containing membrane protein [Actinoplanes capillaceus]